MVRAALVLIVSSITFVFGQIAPPSGSAGTWAGDFLELHNTRDAAGLGAFARGRIAPRMLAMLGGPENAARELLSLYSGLGPLEFAGTQGDGPVTVYFRGTLTGGWVAFHLLMEPATGGGGEPRAARLAIALDERPPGAPDPAPVADEELAAAVGSYLDALATHDLFSGVVMIARGDRTLYEGAFGRADLAGEPIELDTGFALASMNKMFTAVGILRLAEEGLLSLDDPVATHLPNYPSHRVQGVTIGHLLTHGSGLGTFDVDEIRPMRTIAEMLTLRTDPPVFPPGTRYRYSNMGYVLLGAVIESVTGRDFYAYLDERVFEPAGMASTGAFVLEGERPGIATGFLRMDAGGGRRDNLAVRVQRGSPAADFVSTGPDLLRFGRALLDGTLLGDRWRTQAMSPLRPVYSLPGVSVGYGYGMYVETRDGVVTVGHGGGGPGVSTSFAVVPEEDLVLVVLSNYDIIGDVVSRHLKELLGLR